MPPPAPWMKRARINSGSELETAASRVPAARITRVQSNSRSLPYMSPSRPRIEVAIDADSRKPVSSQVTPSSELPSACWIAGRAGITAALSIAYANPPIERTARITVVWTR